MSQETKTLQQLATDHIIFPVVSHSEVTDLGPLVFERGEGI